MRVVLSLGRTLGGFVFLCFQWRNRLPMAEERDACAYWYHVVRESLDLAELFSVDLVLKI